MANITGRALLLTAFLLIGCDRPPTADSEKISGLSNQQSTSIPAVDWPGYGQMILTVDEDLDASPPRVDYRLRTEDGRIVATLPDFYGNAHWSYYDTSGVVFEDINGDSQRDIIILARYMTGIGPDGAEPFGVAGYYLHTNDGFVRANKLEDAVNNRASDSEWEKAEELVELARAQRR